MIREWVGLGTVWLLCVFSFWLMARTTPSYPRIVHRPSEPDRWEVRNEWGGLVSVKQTEREAVWELEHLPYRETTFGQWWRRRREQRERR